MAAQQEIFNECLVPSCGISMQQSLASTTSWETPLTSLPNTIATFCLPLTTKSFSLTLS